MASKTKLYNSTKKIGADDEEEAFNNLENLEVSSLIVNGDAEIQGNISFSTLDINTLGSYQQTGAVDFNNQDISSINVKSGEINNTNIGSSAPANGFFNNLQSGVSGTGYYVRFYGNDTGTKFEFDGPNNILNLDVNTGLKIPNPDGIFHISDVYYNNGQVKIDNNQTIPSAGKIVSGTGVNFPENIVGYYLVLADKTKTKIVERLSSSLLLIDGPNSNGQDMIKSLQNYGIYYPGTFFTSSGNLTSNNTDYMKLPSGPTSDRPTNALSGYVRYNTSLKKFEGFSNTWVDFGGATSIDGTSELILDKFDNDNKIRLQSNNNEILIVNPNNKISIGYINTYGNLGGSLTENILNETSTNPYLIEDLNININAELVDQEKNLGLTVNKVEDDKLTITKTGSFSLTSLDSLILQPNGVNYKLYNNPRSSLDIYGSQSLELGATSITVNNLSYTGGYLNDITINASSYTSLLTQNYQVKITGTSGLNDLVSTITGYSGNTTIQVVIDANGDEGNNIPDKFKISFDNGSTYHSTNISIGTGSPSNSIAIPGGGTINLYFGSQYNHALNSYWIIVVNNNNIISNSFVFSGIDTFAWKLSSDANYSSNINIDTGTQFLGSTGISVKFVNRVGHTLNSIWSFEVKNKTYFEVENNSNIIYGNHDLRDILKVGDTITIADTNSHKRTFIINELQNYNSTRKAYPIKINRAYPHTSKGTLSSFIDDNLLLLYNGFGVPKLSIDKSGNMGINIGIGQENEFPININSTSAIRLPSGTTAQRPSSITSGLLRYNSDSTNLEFYKNDKWVSVGANGILKTSDDKNIINLNANSLDVTVNENKLIEGNRGSLTFMSDVINISNGSITYLNLNKASITASSDILTFSGSYTNLIGSITNIKGLSNVNIESNNNIKLDSNTVDIDTSEKVDIDSKVVIVKEQNKNILILNKSSITASSDILTFSGSYTNLIGSITNIKGDTVNIKGDNISIGETGDKVQINGLTSITGGLHVIGSITGGNLSTKIGEPTNGTYTDNPLLTKNDLIGDAFQTLDVWLNKYLVDTPPAPTNNGSLVDSSKIKLNWKNPTQFELGVLNTSVPKINSINIDYKKSTDTNYTTINTNNSGITSAEFFIEGSGSGVSGSTYNFYTIDKEVNYDFRIYGINDNAERSLHYLTFSNIATVGIGVPSAVLNLSGNVIDHDSFSLSYTKPQYNDSVNQTTNTPNIDNYEINFVAQSSTRYGGLIAHSGNVNNNGTSYSLNNLNPKTNYNIKVRAKNTQNSNYGDYSNTINLTTNFPSAPSYLTTNQFQSISNQSSIDSSYQSTGYSLDGNTAINSPILNQGEVSSNTINVTSNTKYRTNKTESTTSNGITTVIAKMGLVADLGNAANQSSVVIDGFGNASKAGNHNNTYVNMSISSDEDYYSSGSADYQGFYKSIQLSFNSPSGTSSYYKGRTDAYGFNLSMNVSGHTTINTNTYNFYIDNLQNLPAINNLLIKSVNVGGGNANAGYVSGVLVYKQNTILGIQYNMSEIGNYFLRNDRKHAELRVKTSSNSNLSSLLTSSRTDFSTSGKKYYTVNTNKYETSTTLYNTNGYTLNGVDTRPELQFNQYTITLNSSANSIYDENIKVVATPYNLRGNGSEQTGYLKDTSNNNSLGNLRIDGQSLNTIGNLNSSGNNYGIQVRSGYNSSDASYPSGPGTGNNDFGGTYDHSVSIVQTSGAYYNTELQLINGYFDSNNTYGYKNYSSGYYSGVSGYNYPNYSGSYVINNIRYVTFKYTGRVSNTGGVTLDFINHSGLGSDVTNSNITLHIKLNNSGDASKNTAWLNANSSVAGTGVTSSNKDTNGTTCLSTTGTYKSTSTKKYCYLPVASTGDLYVRLGVKLGSSIKLKYIQVSNGF